MGENHQGIIAFGFTNTFKCIFINRVLFWCQLLISACLYYIDTNAGQIVNADSQVPCKVLLNIDIFLLSFCLLGRHFVERQNTWPPRCLRTMIMAELSTGSYLFPEIYIHKDNCTLNIMIMVRWGVGVVMYEMMVGRLPFYNRHVFTFCSSSSSQLPSSSVII